MDRNNTSDFDLLCTQSKSIMADVGFVAVLGLEIALTIPASLFNIILMSTIFRLTVYHCNLRCLLFHHSFNLALFSLSTMTRSIYILIMGMGTDPCRLITSLYTCKLLELITIMPIINSIYSFTIVCLERLYATVHYKTYDSSSRIPWLAIVLIPVVWFISLVYQLNPLPSIPKDRYLPVCANLLSISAKAAMGSLIQCLIMETMALCLIIALYIINSRKMEQSLVNRAKHTLSARFQISQNMEVNSLLIPSLLAHAACFVPIIVYLILVTCGLDLGLNTKMILIHVQYVWISFYAMAHPLLAIVKDAHFRKIYKPLTPRVLIRICGRKRKEAETRNAFVEADLHFKSLEAMWNAKF